MKGWLRSHLLDADEANRTWRLRAIQAEAELRALQVDVPSSPRKSLSRDVEVEAAGDGDTGGPRELGDNEKSRSARAESELQTLLGQVLGFEKHTAECEPWKVKILDEAVACNAKLEILQSRSEEQKDLALQARKEAAEAKRDGQSVSQQRGAVKFAFEAKCLDLSNQVQQLLQGAGLRPAFDGDLLTTETGKAKLSQLDDEVGKLEADLEGATRRREELSMRREEMRGKRWYCSEVKTQCAREVAIAKQALQTRQVIVSRLQGEVSRSRGRGDRRRKQLEQQLVQCRAELADAVARADAAGEQLRKVKQKHGRELRQVRTVTSGLQAEVDAHLQHTERAEEEISHLKGQELDLEGSEQRHLAHEMNLEQEAATARDELWRLEQHVHNTEVEHKTLLGILKPLEDECQELQQAVALAREQAETDSLIATETRTAAEALEHELEAERAECAAQADELTALARLKNQVKGIRSHRDDLSDERGKLEESAKQLRQNLDRQLSDLREVQRRSLQLKSLHDDLGKAIVASGLRTREAIPASVEQALGRVVRKADNLHNYLDAAPSSRRSITSSVVGDSVLSAGSSQRASPGPAATPTSASAQLQQQMLQSAERMLGEELLECRAALAQEQQRFLEASRGRAEQIQSLRAQRRELEEELARVQQDAKVEADRAARSLEELQKHINDLDREVADGAEAVTVEFSDLMQKQALERDLLQSQVEELRGARAEEVRKFDGMEEESPQVLAQRLSEADAELRTLQREEEELIQAHVRLKASMVSRKGNARISPRMMKAVSRLTRAPPTESAAAAAAAVAVAADSMLEQSVPSLMQSSSSRSLPVQASPLDVAASALGVHGSASSAAGSPHHATSSHTSQLPPRQQQQVPSPNGQVSSPHGQRVQTPQQLQHLQPSQANAQLQQQLQSLQQRLRQQQCGQGSVVLPTPATAVTLRRSGSDTLGTNSHGSTVTCTLSTSDSTPRLLRGSLASSLPALAPSGMTLSSPRPASAQPSRIIATSGAPGLTISSRGVSPRSEQKVYTWPSQFAAMPEGHDIRNLISFG